MSSLSPTTVHGEKTVSPARPARSNGVSIPCGSSNDRKHPIKFAIVDDDENDRRMLRQALGKSGEFVCAGSYRSANEALAEIPKILPQVVLMDIRMPGMGGLECTRRLKAIRPQLKIIIVTVLLDTESMNKSIQAGADAYLTKPISAAQCLALIKFTIRSGMLFREKSGTHLHVDILKTGSPLTVRENEIMALIAKGFPFKEVADRLGISFSAVHKHQHNSFRKLGVSNRILYHLARLDRKTLERLIEEEAIRPALKEREARQLVAQFCGDTIKTRSIRAVLRERLRRLAEYFAANLADLNAEDMDLAEAQLTRVLQQIGAAKTAILDATGNSSTCTTQLGPLTDQQNSL